MHIIGVQEEVRSQYIIVKDDDELYLALRELIEILWSQSQHSEYGTDINLRKARRNFAQIIPWKRSENIEPFIRNRIMQQAKIDMPRHNIFWEAFYHPGIHKTVQISINDNAEHSNILEVGISFNGNYLEDIEPLVCHRTGLTSPIVNLSLIVTTQPYITITNQPGFYSFSFNLETIVKIVQKKLGGRFIPNDLEDMMSTLFSEFFAPYADLGIDTETGFHIIMELKDVAPSTTWSMEGAHSHWRRHHWSVRGMCKGVEKPTFRLSLCMHSTNAATVFLLTRSERLKGVNLLHTLCRAFQLHILEQN